MNLTEISYTMNLYGTGYCDKLNSHTSSPFVAFQKFAQSFDKVNFPTAATVNKKETHG